MALLVINYFLAAFLFAFSYYVDFKNGDRKRILTSFCMSASFGLFFIGLAYHTTYSATSSLYVLFFMIGIYLWAFANYLMLRIALFYPYYKPSKLHNFVFVLVIFVLLFAVMTTVESLTYVKDTGYIVVSKGNEFLSLSPYNWFIIIAIIGLPVLSALILFIRSLILRSRIYRTQLRLISGAVIVGTAIVVALYFLSKSNPAFFWITPLAMSGVLVEALLTYKAADITTIVDKRIVFLRIVNGFLTVVLIGVAFGILIRLFYSTGFRTSSPGWFYVVSVAIMALVLWFKIWAEKRVGLLLHADSNYGPEMEKALKAIDYNAGGESVIESSSFIIKKYLECDNIDFLIEGDDGMLSVRYSTTNRTDSFDPHTKGLESLLNQNIMVLFKTQVVTQHTFAEHKAELLGLFGRYDSDAMIIMQEARHLIGIIMLGAKRTGSDYTVYDHDVISTLYSNFFVIMYYLKNIANESVVMTVDRELEYSGQIIQSIQENVDRINHEKISVDYISRSARKLGGDFIDFIRLSADRYIFVMGDVSGKGLNASMSMVILKSVIRTYLQETGDFKELVVKVNGFIKTNLPKGTFFGGVFGLLDLASNNLFYLNCGIPTMLLYTSTYNNAVEIQGEGHVLGFVDNIGDYIRVKKIHLNADDTLLLTTDGLIDSVSLRGERYGKERVQRFLVNNRHYPAARITQFLVENLMDFTSTELTDDITVLAMKFMSK